jgi:hypothetical protein
MLQHEIEAGTHSSCSGTEMTDVYIKAHKQRGEGKAREPN